MAANLAELFLNSFGDHLIKQTSGQLGESAQGISSSLNTILPSVIGTMIMKINSDTGVRGLLEFISGNGLENTTIDSPDSSEGGLNSETLMVSGSTVLNYLVGKNQASMIDWISAAGGLKTSSASSMLRIVAPLFMGYFSRVVKERNLNTSGVKELLLSHIDYVQQNTPEGLMDLLEFSRLGDTPNIASTMNSSVGAGTSLSHEGMSKFLPWLILGLVSLALFYFLQKGCNLPLN